jgi:Flp pilus assembly protein TadB
LIDALNAIADSLRSGASLRQALVRVEEGVAGEGPSPFAAIAQALRDGRPLVPTLHAASTGASDADLAMACCVLAVHAEAGGDPLPACRALVDRIAERQSRKDETRALTTQSRLGARTILLLTPAFLLLVAITDPGGAVRWFADPNTRSAVVVGLGLQAVGAWWISTIVAVASGGRSRSSRIPLLRALAAMLAGRAESAEAECVAECSRIVVLVCEAGLSPTAAMCAAAPHARGRFGDALRAAVADVEVPLCDALDDGIASLGDAYAERFARAIRAATELGVPLAPALRGLCDDIEQASDVRAAEAIRSASVRVLVPLGVLVLPAFVLACLVPLFVGGIDGIAG